MKTQNETNNTLQEVEEIEAILATVETSIGCKHRDQSADWLRIVFEYMLGVPVSSLSIYMAAVSLNLNISFKDLHHFKVGILPKSLMKQVRKERRRRRDEYLNTIYNTKL